MTSSAAIDRTVGDWFQSIEPAPPPALAARLEEALRPFVAQPASSVPEACLAAGTRVLETLLASGSTSRASAIDLLAVDSLVTYAFEVTSDSPDFMESRAASAMTRIASIPGDLSA